MNDEEICFLSAQKMGDMINNGEITSQELTELFIERIKKINPLVNAYCTTTFDLAREMAVSADKVLKNKKEMGLLNGIPMGIKDLMLTKGIRTTFGCKIYEDYIPEEDEIVVKRLKDAGGVLLGKTNTPAFGYWTLTDNLIFGSTKNPWDLRRNSGGSSGGAAAQVASGLGPLALGSDGGGSIRVPSCFCGVYGLKPSFGRIPRYPTHDVTWLTLDHYGPIVRYVEDAALMLDVMAGEHIADKYSLPDPQYQYREIIKEKPSKLKIGYSLNLGFIKAIDEEVEVSFHRAKDEFSRLGWVPEEVKIKLKKPYKAFATLVCAGFAYDLKKYLKEWRDKLDIDFLKQIEAGLGFSAIDVKQAEELRYNVYKVFMKFFQEYDILLTPSTAVPPLNPGEIFPAKIRDKSVSPTEWFSFSYPFNLAWLPAASIPCGWTKNGLPVGLQIIGKKWDDKTVLQVSKAYEELNPWQDRKPQLN